MNHDGGREWVYNAADIDNAKVVWAREMDPVSNRALLRYFAGRSAWLAEPDAVPPRLSPYDPSQPPDPPFRFVKLGTEAIEVLRNPEEIRRKILDVVAREQTAPYRFSCDQWAYYFNKVTGVQAPEAANGCFPPGNWSRVVDFDAWFAWLQNQKRGLTPFPGFGKGVCPLFALYPIKMVPSDPIHSLAPRRHARH